MSTSEDLFGQQHVERYVATDGEEGYAWREGTTILLLTTTGRRSGSERVTPLIFRPWEDAYLVVASKGGTDDPPAWYRNLEASTDVTVQVRGDRFAARARTASEAEKPAMWAEMVDAWPHYEEYQAKTSRVIPVVVLTRSQGPER